MYQILKSEKVADNTWQMVIHAPWVARSCQPGQFIILRVCEEGERVPLTITDYDREAGTVSIVFQTVGVSTSKLSQLQAGDSVVDFVGPLGNPSDLISKPIEELKKQNLLFIGGGVGTAPVYPQVKWLHEHGVGADVIIGARTKDLIILEDEMREVASNVYIATDDGSYGFHGVAGKCLESLAAEGKHYDHAVVIGPMIMMKFTCVTTKQLGIPTVVSMNTLMVDGTGMCGCCRLSVGGETKFACVDGPEFDGFQVDYDEAMKRSTIYKTEEGRKFLEWKEGATHSGGCGQCGGEN